MADLISRAAAIDAIVSVTVFSDADYIKNLCQNPANSEDWLGGVCDAINAVEEVAAVDAAPVQQWISVKDRLPQKQGFYLAFVPKMAMVTLYYNGYDWIVDDDFYVFGAYEITHWMPLPEPPKIEGESDG